jgi:hypothetical protein
MAASKSAKRLKTAALRPYLAPVLLHAATGLKNDALLAEVAKEVESIGLRSSDRVVRKRLESSPLGTAAGLRFHALAYSETTTPTWFVSTGYQDIANQLIVIAVRDKHAMICASDGSARDRIVSRLKSAKPMPSAAFAGFVGGEAAAIWLNGIHAPTAVKPNTKFLTGVSLEYALDPLGDQTYRYSAIRSCPDIPELKNGRTRGPMVGAAPDSARVWIGRPPDWKSFAKQLAAILSHALIGKPATSLYGFLASPVADVSAVKDPYAISVLPGELLLEDAIDEDEREEARLWSYDARFEIVGKSGLSPIVEPYLNEQRLGRASLNVAFAGEKAELAVKWIESPAGTSELRRRCESVLADPEKVKIYYDSGHTLTQGRCYETGFTDQPFDWTFEPMAGFEIDREKPKFSKASPLANNIGLTNDKSLFGFVKKKLYSNGWLACDDGSMELADFIHIDPAASVVTLIHVKASEKKQANRQVSVADYEIVVSQAVKNVRHLDRRNLESELRDGKGKKIGAAVWKDGVKQANRDGFLAAAKALPANAKKVAMIIQPRLTSTEHAACSNPATSKTRRMRMKQLNALMLSARLSAMACGADLVGVAEKI